MILFPRDAERFWASVQKGPTPDACWDWMKRKLPHGYGQFFLIEGTVLAHRLSYQMHAGAIPDGLSILHRCDRPCCVNPAHLFVGTQADNMKDCKVKGRNIRGERHWAHKNPEKSSFYGEQNPSIRFPEKLVRGDAHWSRHSPEKLPRGENNKSSKLTEDQVRQIRHLRKTTKDPQWKIARQFGITQTVVSDILLGRLWAHVK